MVSLQPCPCGTSLSLSECCGQYIYQRKKAPTAQALMRSRFTAYCQKQADYLLATWHRSTRPQGLAWDDGSPQWERLDVLNCEEGGLTDSTGWVEFRAFYFDREGQGVLHERSRFERVDGEWLYVTGKIFPRT